MYCRGYSEGGGSPSAELRRLELPQIDVLKACILSSTSNVRDHRPVSPNGGRSTDGSLPLGTTPLVVTIAVLCMFVVMTILSSYSRH